MRMKNVRDIDTMVTAILLRKRLTSAGAISGTPEYEGVTGQLNPAFLADELGLRTARYIVYSYRTPMAWVCADGTWKMPAVKYSVTTTRHQTTIRAAMQRVEQYSTDTAEAERQVREIIAQARPPRMPQPEESYTGEELTYMLDSVAARLADQRRALEQEEAYVRRHAQERAIHQRDFDALAAERDHILMTTPVPDDPYAKLCRARLAEAGEYIAAEATPYDKAGQWHSRSHP